MGAEDELLEAVHDSHADALYRYVVRRTGDEEEARDVVQETLLRAWRHPEVLERSEESVRSWLFTVARNLVVDHLRSARRNREHSTASVPDRQEHDRTHAVLDSWLVADALLALSPDHRAVVVGAYYRGRSVAELATEHGIPPGTVKSRLHYGLRALRLALQEKGVTS
ncbi:sigma-70 family RNA polymerase sigma factor [Myceligenerans salitolerans]|uniref:Sigma-70 family RNA polymerase sigma factor n=1 Tax=Myceligenerans salitolerans TaxID=1230528 RepID=A0ABS3I789_9MICO|nr:sigma-70 family RNA polymerase sigma factor [Myceligenerans salitolerans]MBO0608828.1 sigma-70 family RNA polymerase sigma factor [Myceligenerans salitolerans]